MEAREWLEQEVSKCVYCGFCEAVCPTLHAGGHRGYGPRGRINIIKKIVRDGEEPTPEALNSLYTCLLCGACDLQCPVGIRIAQAIREARPLVNRMAQEKGLRITITPALKRT